MVFQLCSMFPTTFCISKWCEPILSHRGHRQVTHLWVFGKHFFHSEKTVTAPHRRPTGQRFLNTEPGARAQSYTSCFTDTLLWGASSSITACVSMHDWRLDWDMFVAAFVRRSLRFCVHLHNGSETTQPRLFSVFAFNYVVFLLLSIFNMWRIKIWPVGFHRQWELAFMHLLIYIKLEFWFTFIGSHWK